MALSSAAEGRKIELAAGLLYRRSRSAEEKMKFARECSSEGEAEARERFLTAAGYQAWRKHSPDGRWQVFWVVPMPR